MAENNGRSSENGRFLPGNPGKPHGAKSNASAKVKAAVVEFLEKNVDQIQESFDKLKPIEKLQFITAILPYAAPKLQSVETAQSGQVDHHFTVTWVKPHELPAFINEGGLADQSGHNGQLPDHR